MKKLSQSGELNEDTMLSIMMEQKKPEKNDITLSGEKLRKYFPRSYTPFQIENTIFKLLDAWQKKRQRDQKPMSGQAVCLSAIFMPKRRTPCISTHSNIPPRM